MLHCCHYFAIKMKVRQVGGTTKGANGKSTTSTTPSKVLRSGKRIPPSTIKKPKALSKLNDGITEEVSHLLSDLWSSESSSPERSILKATILLSLAHDLTVCTVSWA